MKTLLALHATSICVVGLFYCRFYGFMGTTHQNKSLQKSVLQKPSAMPGKKWDYTEVFGDALSNEEQQTISSVCTDRNVITTPQSSSHQVFDDGISWTICMTINSGFYDFFRNWYRHYKLLDLKLDIVLFAEDPEAYEQLLNATFLDMEHTIVVNAPDTDTRPTLSRVETKPPQSASASVDEQNNKESSASLNVSEGVFDAGSYGYKQLISNRPTRVLRILCSGRNVLYIDTDTVLRKNPLPVINKNYLDGADISIALDFEEDFTSYQHQKQFCTGFIAIKANADTIHFLSEWEKKCHDNEGHPLNDQLAFNQAYELRYILWQVTNASMVNVKGLPTALFPNGRQYFKMFPEFIRERTILVHANWIIGAANKKQNLMDHGLWNPE